MAPIMVRQPYVSITAPPTTGPTAGPADMTMPAMPIAVPRFSTGNTSMGTTETSGMSTPEPAACQHATDDEEQEIRGCGAQQRAQREHQRRPEE